MNSAGFWRIGPCRTDVRLQRINIMENTALQSRVEAELQWEPSIDASEIGVAVANGVVTLSGAVRTYAEKTAAERSALRIKGVRGVAQEIEVRPFGDIGVKDDEIAKRALRVMQ
jgi:hypothetical protein